MPWNANINGPYRLPGRWHWRPHIIVPRRWIAIRWFNLYTSLWW